MTTGKELGREELARRIEDRLAGRSGRALWRSLEELSREPAVLAQEQAESNRHGWGRELFAGMRRNAVAAEEGACTWL